MSHFRDLTTKASSSCPEKYLTYKMNRTLRVQEEKEKSTTPKAKAMLATQPLIIDRSILERAGTLLRAERFWGEIMAEYMKKNKRISRHFIEELFSRKAHEDEIIFALRLLQFKKSYLISHKNLIDYEEKDKNKLSLMNHLVGYANMKAAFLGKNPKFKDQYANGQWEFVRCETPVLPPEAFLRAEIMITLDLDSCNIAELPAEIGKCISLTHLNLCFTFISELPEEIGKLQNLNHLNISECKNLKTLPATIVNLRNLQHLIFIWHGENSDHNFEDCYKNHKCTQDICNFFFQDLTIPQQKWLRQLKLNRSHIEGLHIGQIKK